MSALDGGKNYEQKVLENSSLVERKKINFPIHKGSVHDGIHPPTRTRSWLGEKDVYEKQPGTSLHFLHATFTPFFPKAPPAQSVIMSRATR